MRPLSKAEQNKRGCRYCLYVGRMKGQVNGRNTTLSLACPANRCPFRELDYYHSYTDYLKTYGAQTLKAILMKIGMAKPKRKKPAEKPIKRQRRRKKRVKSHERL